MFNLNDKNISYMIVSPEDSNLSDMENKVICNRFTNILYNKEYTIADIKSQYRGHIENSFICISYNDNVQLKNDAIFLIENFNIGNIVLKYKGNSSPIKISFKGDEFPLSTHYYSNEINEKVYLYNGISFLFKDEKRYLFPRAKNDLKSGMIIEYFNNHQWKEKTIKDIESEYENMYKLLIKYNKIRVSY